YAWVRRIALRLAPSRRGSYLHLCAGFEWRGPFSLKLNPLTRHPHELCAATPNTGARRDDSLSLSSKATTMRTKRSVAAGVIGILAIVGLLGWTASAQAPPATLVCDHDPPADTTQIDAALLIKGLPCAEKVSPDGPFGDALANL